MKPKNIRADIQALRTLAVAMVVTFHLWPLRMTGGFVGVDVFFVISGFLITGHIMREIQKNKFSVFSFWARRIRRLLPASFTVLLLAFISVLVLVPGAQWQQWLNEIQASTLYAENWKLAADAVDYLALSNSASPTQHFWSLSVEEQFYLVWPILAIFSLIFAGNGFERAKRAKRFALIIFLTIFAGSFCLGIYLTLTDPAVAYFSSPVRAWEFALGGLVSFMNGIRGARARNVVAILGLVLIGGAGLIYKASMPFPGWLALIPVVGTALVILAKVESGWLQKVFSLRPIRFIGDRSYSIYLWHWPLIILTPYAIGQELDARWKLGILFATILFAWASYRFIERPFIVGKKLSSSRPRAVFTVLAIVTLIFSGSLFMAINANAATLSKDFSKSKVAASRSIPCFGAAARPPGQPTCENPKITGTFPSIDTALEDYSFSSRVCGSMKRDDSTPKVCKLGVKKSETRIALIGDSHMGQYVGAFVKLAKKNNWELELYWKGGCPFSETHRVHDEVLGAACDTWIQKSKNLILSGNYDVVVTTMASGVTWKVPNGVDSEKESVLGLAQMWRGLNSRGLPVIAIKDNPRPIPSHLKCMHLKGESSCDAKRSTAFKYDPIPGAVSLLNSPLTQLVNFDDVFCAVETCPSIIGHVVVYRGDSHLTNTFTTTLAPYFEPYIFKALKQ